MHTPHEKDAFAKRLRAAAVSASPSVGTAAELARQFSLRYKNGTVTPAAVRKWWDGTTLPSDDKLEVLAHWFKVSKHWLRYGETPKGKHGESPTEPISSEEVLLLQRWRTLPPRRRKILLSLLTDMSESM